VKPDEHCWEVSIELVGRNVEERYFYGIYLQTFRYKTVQITRLDNNFRRRRPETPSITVITLMAKLHGNCLRTSSLTENCCRRRNDTNPLQNRKALTGTGNYVINLTFLYSFHSKSRNRTASLSVHYTNRFLNDISKWRRFSTCITDTAATREGARK
jgi:hypothetical protein